MLIPKRFTEQDQQAILAAYHAGLGPRRLAEEHGTKPETITAILKRFGVDVARHRNKFSIETEHEIAKRYANGEMPKLLAAEYGCAQHTIRQIAKRHGVEINPRGGRYREFSQREIEEMARRWEGGESQTAIAQRFGTHQTIVGRVLQGAGYSRPARVRRGASSNLWRGGRTISGEGYVLLHAPPDHAYASMRGRTGYIPEHRLVMAESLGRPLTSKETVHHINGDRKDNRLENLQLRQGRHGNGVELCCADCGSRNIVPAELTET